MTRSNAATATDFEPTLGTTGTTTPPSSDWVCSSRSLSNWARRRRCKQRWRSHTFSPSTTPGGPPLATTRSATLSLSTTSASIATSVVLCLQGRTLRLWRPSRLPPCSIGKIGRPLRLSGDRGRLHGEHVRGQRSIGSCLKSRAPPVDPMHSLPCRSSSSTGTRPTPSRSSRRASTGSMNSLRWLSTRASPRGASRTPPTNCVTSTTSAQ
eukprot:UN3784